MTRDSFDLAIVGGGPAGLAAMDLADECGLSCVLIDENSSLGGRIFHGIETDGQDHLYGTDATWARTLVADAKHAGSILTGRTVFDITHHDDGPINIHILGDEGAETVLARRLLIATGATERPFAFPGWTLPGVMTAGGVQTLLKGAAVVPDGPVVLAGSGPLLLLVALQLKRAGAQIAALLDTTPAANAMAAAPLLASAAFSGFAVWRGLGLLMAIRAQSIPVYRGVTKLVAHGEDTVASVEFEHGRGRRRFECRLLVTHLGILPDTQAARLAGCRLRWEPALPGWVPIVDSYGNTSRSGIMIAGDAAGIGGAESARHAGRVAATEAATQLGAISMGERDHRIAPDLARLKRLGRERAFLDRLFLPPERLRVPTDDGTIVCRCEEITAGELRAQAAGGVCEINQVKAITRCGMGPCQGRVCGVLAADIIADAMGAAVESVGYLRVRPPLKPVPLDVLAARAEIATPPPEAAFLYTREG